MGFEPLAGPPTAHTYKSEITMVKILPDKLTQTIQKEFDSDRFVVEYEKHMKAWVAAKKNRNFGWVINRKKDYTAQALR